MGYCLDRALIELHQSGAFDGISASLVYPSPVHSHMRLMVAACVAARVVSATLPPNSGHLPAVRLSLSPTPRIQLDE